MEALKAQRAGHTGPTAALAPSAARGATVSRIWAPTGAADTGEPARRVGAAEDPGSGRAVTAGPLEAIAVVNAAAAAAPDALAMADYDEATDFAGMAGIPC